MSTGFYIGLLVLFVVILTVVLILFYGNRERTLRELVRELKEELRGSRADLDRRLQYTNETMQNISRELGRLTEISRTMLDIGKNIKTVEELLKPPKLRGAIGEYFLEEILRQILPTQSFAVQYKFKDGTIVDAVIFLSDGKILPIDSKFPLDSFRKFVEAKDEHERQQSLKNLSRDLKKHIEDIAQKYIKPEENTVDFAMMYIPSESVFFEALRLKDAHGNYILNFAYQNRVFVVWPSTIYFYLLTILQSIRSFEIAEKPEISWPLYLS